MKGFTVEFRDRTITPVFQLPFEFDPQSHSRNAIGGHKTAEIKVDGPAESLRDLLDMLLYRLIIYNPDHLPVWWGYIHEVILNYGNVRKGVTLDNLYNYIKISYNLVAVGGTASTAKTTAAASDAYSIAQYGYRELVQSINQASDDQAEKTRDRLLDIHKNPIIITDPDAGDGSYSATLRCRGWWSTLDWRYYTEAGTANTATSAQLSDMILDGGQFITLPSIPASGINSNQTRNGSRSCLDEITDIMKAGTTNLVRYVSDIDWNYVTTVAEEAAPPTPAAPNGWLLQRDGTVTNFLNMTIPVGYCPLGWCRSVDLPGASPSQTKISDPSMFYIEESEWSDGKLRLTARGAPNPYDIIGAALS